ncbi:MAG TPA: N-acetylmuramic acid 6-phosphate etherase [Trueperaceae bacterium]|nr:N-acetylmuramic acid 6-phosphate etherase [Trueperaceae bacterium]
MSTEGIDPRYAGLDTWEAGRILEAVTDSNARAVAAVERALPALTRAAEGIEERLAGGGRLVYVGAGTSGRLGVLDAAELAPTFGYDDVVVLMAGGGDAFTQAKEGAEDDVEAAVADLERAGVGRDDAVVGLAASGRTPYTVGAVRRARSLGAFTVGIANNPGAPLLEAADVGVLLDTGPEVLAGSTRLAAGTAQKAALNALSTTVMVRLGGSYDNLMVGMRPLNAKLVERAAGIVARATGRGLEEAHALLQASGRSIRVAIVMGLTGADEAAARSALEGTGGRVRAAVAALG